MKKVNASKKRSRLGRRPSSSPKIDRQTILARGLQLAKTVPLQDISVTRIASAFGVTAASIRYHLRSRDALTAGIVNMFYKDVLARWPAITDNWRDNISAVAMLLFRSYLRYPGVAIHLGAESRIRILLSAIQADVDSTMPLFLERYFATFRALGLGAERTTSYSIILLQLIQMAAHATMRHQWPRENRLVEKHLQSLDPTKFPHTVAMRDDYLKMEGESAIRAALHLVILGLENERLLAGSTD